MDKTDITIHVAVRWYCKINSAHKKSNTTGVCLTIKEGKYRSNRNISPSTNVRNNKDHEVPQIRYQTPITGQVEVSRVRKLKLSENPYKKNENISLLTPQLSKQLSTLPTTISYEATGAAIHA